MKIIKADEEGIQKAIQILKAGGVVAHATDTCFGLAADIKNEEAVRKIALIKKTSTQKPISIIVRNIQDVEKVAHVTHEQLEFIHNYLPGPYTIIIPKKQNLEYQNFERNIGIRIPDNALSMRLVEGLESPITTTSANISGESPTYSAGEVKETFAREIFQPDLILDSGPIPKNPPSKIVNLCEAEEVWIR